MKKLLEILVLGLLFCSSAFVEKNIMKNQSTRKLEKDLLKLHTKDLTDTDKLTILHLILDGKIVDAKKYVETSRRT